ncbi:MAG: hypothetical protein KAU35_08630 [candidate division Zixibacteria bacterium]|nr:hypothetical protein [candidate division Zixibacteria bacterium]
MEWEKQLNEERPRLSPVARSQLILMLIGGVVGFSISLFTDWESIPLWARYPILGFIGIAFMVTLVLSIIPASHLFRGWIASIGRRRQQRRTLLELAGLLQEARMLFEPNASNSLRAYVDSICNSVVQDQSVHPQLKRLAERLHLLEDWHWSLLTFANPGLISNAPFTDIVRHIVRLYRDTADVVRELAIMKMPEDGSVRAYDDQRRMMKEKYNQHIGRVEQLLERIAKVNPELQTGAFHRF